MKAKQAGFYALFTWLLVFGCVPILFVVATSFLTQHLDGKLGLPITFDAYAHLLHPIFTRLFLRSVALAGITTLICLLLAFPFCYFMVKSRLRAVMLLLIIIPFWSSSLVRTYALLALLKKHGLVNTALLKLHLINAPLPLLYNNFAVVLGLVYNLLPFMILPLYSQMERFDFRLMEAARDLGARSHAIFWRVFLPANRTGMVSGCLFVFLPALTLFYIPNILGGARSVLLGNLIQSQFMAMNNWPLGSATSVSLIVLMLVLIKLCAPIKIREGF